MHQTQWKVNHFLITLYERLFYTKLVYNFEISLPLLNVNQEGHNTTKQYKAKMYKYFKQCLGSSSFYYNWSHVCITVVLDTSCIMIRHPLADILTSKSIPGNLPLKKLQLFFSSLGGIKQFLYVRSWGPNYLVF